MIRRIDRPPVAGQTYTLRPGAYAILPRDGQVLLTCQNGPAPDIQLPGGGIDPGESPLRALHREVFEETGWRIARPRKLGAFRRFAYMPEYDLWAEKICHIYVAWPALCLSDPSEADHDAIWMDPQAALLALGNDGDRMFVARYFG
jgi:8-oxo-dGTP diphosphatase